MNRLLLSLAVMLSLAAPPFSAALAQTLITQTPAPADWGQADLSGIRVFTPPGWTEVERHDDVVTFFGGDMATHSGPGFTLRLESDPMQMLKGDDFQDLGVVTFDNGAVFHRYGVSVTPEVGLTIAGEFLVSSVPLVNGKFLMAGALGYNVSLDESRTVFDTTFAALGIPAPGVAVLQTALNGAFEYVMPEGWETGSYDDAEALILDQDGGQGKVTLMRFAVDSAGSYRSGLYHPDDITAVPVIFLGHPALSYEWKVASKHYSDGRDSLEVRRLFVFETCLANGDTGAVEVTGMPDFHTSAPVMRLLDQMVFAPDGALGAPCRAIDLPDGAPLAAPLEGRPKASGFTLWIAPHTAEDSWRAEVLGNVSLNLPESWTGADGVWMSSRGEYQLTLFQTPDAPVLLTEPSELRLPDGTRFFLSTIPDGTRAVSAAPIDATGYLVIEVTGSQMDGAGIVEILGTIRLPAITAVPAQSGPQSVLNDLATVVVPQGFDLTVTENSATLTAQDGRGFLALARGADLLPPDGWIIHIPEGQHGSYAAGNMRDWSEYGWKGTTSDFKDEGAPDNGWYFLNILRECLPDGEPIAFVWGGTSQFTGGETLSQARNAFTFNWPDGMIACDPVVETASLATSDQPEAPSAEASAPVEDSIHAAAAPSEPATSDDWLGKVPSAALPSPATDSLAGRWQEPPQTVVPMENSGVEPPDAAQPEMPSASVTTNLPPAPPASANPAVDRDHFTPLDGGYSTYQNDRYGTFISYPSTYFQPEPAPDSGDGRRFASIDGTARFYVFAQYNALGQSQAEQIAQDKADPAHGNVSYERVGPGWYVLSGITGEDIYYRRVIEDMNGLIQVFEITYPLAQKADFDSVVAYMADSFGPGSDITTAAPADDAQPSAQQDAELLNIGWWVVVGTFPAEPSQRQTADFASIQSLGARCSLVPFNDLSGKFQGFKPGFNVFVLGAYDSKPKAMEVLQQAQACYPDAYIKYAEYLGE